jgi:hypothetical protein
MNYPSKKADALTEWNRVSKKHPCPICHKPDYCGVSSTTGIVVCMRVPSPKSSRNGGWVHVVEYICHGTKRTLSNAPLLYNKSWKRSLFNLVRHIRFDKDGTTDDVTRAVEDWLVTFPNPPHARIAKQYSVTCWDNARQGTNADRLTVACFRALGGTPAAPMAEGVTALVWRVCYWLSQEEPVFFVPCDQSAKQLNVQSMGVWRALRELESCGVIETVKRGDRYTGPCLPGEKRPPARSTRYRLTGKHKNTTPPEIGTPKGKEA